MSSINEVKNISSDRNCPGDLHLVVGEEEIEARLASWQALAPKYTSGFLGLHCRLAQSADRGAIVEFTTGNCEPPPKKRKP
jgi:dihydroxy-acid dehydratase